jgi:hypothetical protein
MNGRRGAAQMRIAGAYALPLIDKGELLFRNWHKLQAIEDGEVVCTPALVVEAHTRWH